MDAELNAGPDVADRGARHGVDAGGIAHGPGGIELGYQIAAGTFQLVASLFSRLPRIATLRHRPADTGGQAALAHQSADPEPRRDRSPGGMEEDRQLAAAELFQQRPQTAIGAGIESAVGGDPFLASGAACIRLALGK